eukprot:TRINITY_DN67778_c8_g2_i1.p1 TRINITY_DN67778_c8_g2~~TRINITY_DN67778_c8_g2_i1.p1  ORF type:complete len:140 (-),score=15.90 TRINITY_DN67778_c8_g2_i1:233-652(-)
MDWVALKVFLSLPPEHRNCAFQVGSQAAQLQRSDLARVRTDAERFVGDPAAWKLLNDELPLGATTSQPQCCDPEAAKEILGGDYPILTYCAVCLDEADGSWVSPWKCTHVIHQDCFTGCNTCPFCRAEPTQPQQQGEVD